MQPVHVHCPPEFHWLQYPPGPQFVHDWQIEEQLSGSPPVPPHRVNTDDAMIRSKPSKILTTGRLT